MFSITSDPLDADALRKQLRNPGAGGFVSFEGWVRNHDSGRAVLSLSYEAMESLAIKEGQRILNEAKDRFGALEVHCEHRVGDLAIEDLAVWIGVSCAHRNEAFEACRYIIDEIKVRLPIWKKENYADGKSHWVNCQRCSEHVSEHPNHTVSFSTNVTEEGEYYSRQILLKEVGEIGQEKLKNSRVLVVGAGGLGSPALMYLAASGIGTLGICEGDRLELHNLHRQIIYDRQSVGQAKSQLSAKRLRDANPFIAIIEHPDALNTSNSIEIFNQYDLIIDATDNFASKFLINDTAVLTGTILVQAAIYQYEGQIHSYHPAENGPCLRCTWPDTPESDCIGTCAEVGILGVVPGVFGTLQATEALKILLNLPGSLVQGDMLIFNLLDYQSNRLRRGKDPGCPLCGKTPSILEISPENYENIEDWELDVSRFSPGELAKELAKYKMFDIRDAKERAAAPITGITVLDNPEQDIKNSMRHRTSDERYLLICHKGLRSKQIARKLRDEGDANVYSLRRGIDVVLSMQEGS